MTTKQAEHLTRLTEDYKAARLARDEARAAYEKLSKKLKDKTNLLIDYMNEKQIKSTPKDDFGFMITKVRKPTISSTQENREQIREWLISTYGDDVDYVEEVVKKSAVTELIDDELKRNLRRPEDYPAFLKLNTHPHVQVTGWKEWKMQHEATQSE